MSHAQIALEGHIVGIVGGKAAHQPLRSPVRPNPIAMSVVRLLGVEGHKLSVTGLDCLDGTALLDIKPYFASTDAAPEAVVGWHRERKR